VCGGGAAGGEWRKKDKAGLEGEIKVGRPALALAAKGATEDSAKG